MFYVIIITMRKSVYERVYGQNELKEMICRWQGAEHVPSRIRIITDTSDFFHVDYDDALILNDRPYLMRNNEKEGRFGLNDEPKYWVRHAVDLLSGEIKVIKMVFHEKFKIRVGKITFDCIRSPLKEARILGIVEGHPHFMQGFAVKDAAGNIIRILDYIHGAKLSDNIHGMSPSHEDYFFHHFPSVLNVYIEMVKAIGFLHNRGEKHGDIRGDHLILDNQTGNYRWIDFDFNYFHRESFAGYDFFGLGNLLTYITAQKYLTLQNLVENDSPALRHLTQNDLNVIFRNRVSNLQKVYPYIPDSLNLILLHFSQGAHVFYESASELLSDLMEVKNELH